MKNAPGTANDTPPPAPRSGAASGCFENSGRPIQRCASVARSGPTALTRDGAHPPARRSTKSSRLCRASPVRACDPRVIELMLARNRVEVACDFRCILAKLHRLVAPRGNLAAEIKAKPRDPRLLLRCNLLCMPRLRPKQKRLARIEPNPPPRPHMPRAPADNNQRQFVEGMLMSVPQPGPKLRTERHQSQRWRRLPKLHVCISRGPNRSKIFVKIQ